MYSRKRLVGVTRRSQIDAIAQSLTTSASAYTSASAGSWVKITSAEYTALQTNVSNMTIAGTTAATYTSIGTSVGVASGGLAVTNVVGSGTPAIPANSYVFAVSIYYAGTNSSVRFFANNSISSYTNFSQIGGVLPTTTSGDNYYVLKGASSVTASSAGNLLVWVDQAINLGGKPFVANDIRFLNTATPPTTGSSISNPAGNNNAVAIQALTTTSKQW